MTPRTILYTGKGGVGKTSVAAATARRCAAAGMRTLVVSTDPAHSLSDALGVAVSGDPTPVGDNGLQGQQIQAQEEMERNWAAVQDWLGELLIEHGVNRITAEELTVPPGMDELFSLLALKRHHESGDWDVIVVDCAPTGETLRLLAFPDVARWWLEKVFPWENQILAAAAPFARAVLDMPMPSPAVMADVRGLVENLIAMHEILRNRERVTLRLVMNPDRMVIDEAMRTFTYLNLYGYLCDAVVVNRVFPEAVADSYFGAWRERQQEHLELVRGAFEPLPVLCAPYFENEVVGATMLDRLAEALFDDHAPAAVLHTTLTQELELGEGTARLRLALPFARKGSVSLKQIGEELIVRVDGQKRTIMLPPALRELRPDGAKLEDGALEISFSAAEREALVDVAR
ncbi:MAG: arsenic-transporting ATPase [Solirubrobacterales bacterium]|nr:MAG: arsenic-transporting ATPase [Solirubrobacterales bacterium]